MWEQALESALRKRLVSIGDVTRQPAGAGSAGPPAPHPPRACWRPSWCSWPGRCPGLPEPVRQLWIEAAQARLDLAWPQLGLFIELDGQHHKDQPVYDARRETAVVAATGWLCGRFTWTEVVHTPNSTARRLAALADQARRRPLPQLPRSSSATR